MSNRRNSCWRTIANQFDSTNPPPPGVADDFLTPPLPFSPPPRPPPLPPNSPPLLRTSSPSSSSSKNFMSLSTCSDHAKKSGSGTATTTTATSTSPTNSKWCFYNGVIYDYPLANPPASIYQFSNYWYHQTPIVYQPAYVSVSRNVQMEQRKTQSSCSRRPRRYYRDYSKKSTEYYRSFRHRLRSSSADRDKDDKYHQTAATKGKSKRSYHSTADRNKSSDSMSSKKPSDKSKEEIELATSRTSEDKKSSSSKRDLRESSVSSKSSSGSSENNSHMKSITSSNNMEKNSLISSKYEKCGDASNQKSRGESKCSVETEREIAAKFQTKLPFSNKKIKFYLNSSHLSEKSKDLDSKEPARESKTEKKLAKSSSEKNSSSLSGKSWAFKATENKKPTETKKTLNPNPSKPVTKPKEIKNYEESKPKPTTMLLEKLKAIQMEASKSHSYKESKPMLTKADNDLHEKANNPQPSTLPENSIEDKWSRAFGSNSSHVINSSKTEMDKKLSPQINQKTPSKTLTTNITEDNKKSSLSPAMKCQFKDENLKIILKRVPEVWNIDTKKNEIPIKSSCSTRSILKPKPEIVDEDSEDVVPVAGNGFKRYRILSSDSEIEDDPTTWKDLKPFNSQAQKRCRSRIIRRRPKTLSETSSDSSPERKKTSPTNKLSQSIIETVYLSEISSSSDTGSENSPQHSALVDKQLPIINATADNCSQLSNMIYREIPIENQARKVENSNKNQVKKLKNPIKNQVKNLENPIEIQFEKLKNPIKNQVKNLENPIKNQVKNLENPIEIQFEKLKNPIKNQVKNLENPIKNQVEKFENPIEIQFEKLKNPIKNLFKTLENPTEDQVKKLENLIKNEVKKLENIKNQIKTLENPIILDSNKTKQLNINYEPEEGEIVDDEDELDLWNNVVFDNKLINKQPVVEETTALENKLTSNLTYNKSEIEQSASINLTKNEEKQQNEKKPKTLFDKNQLYNSRLCNVLQSISDDSSNVSLKKSRTGNSLNKPALFQNTKFKNDEKEVEEIRCDTNEDMDVDVETVMNEENPLKNKNETDDDLPQIVQVISLDNSLGEQTCSNVSQEIVIDEEGCTIMQIMDETVMENAMILHLEDQLMEDNKSEIFNEFLDFLNEKQIEEKEKKEETTQTISSSIYRNISINHAASPEKSQDVKFIPENQDLPLSTSEMFQALPEVIMQDMTNSVSQIIAKKTSDAIHLENVEETTNLTQSVQESSDSTQLVTAKKMSNLTPQLIHDLPKTIFPKPLQIIQLEVPESTPEVITQEIPQVMAQETNKIITPKLHQVIVQKTHEVIANKTVQVIGQKKSQVFAKSQVNAQKRSQMIAHKTLQLIELNRSQGKATPRVTAQEPFQLATKEIPQVTVQKTNNMVSQETVKVVTQETAKVVTEETAKVVTEETAKVVTKETAKVVPQETAKVVPQETAKVVPQETPKVISQETSKVILQETPKVILQETPKMIFQETPKVIHQETPKAVSQETPQVSTPKKTKVFAQETLQVTPQETLPATPQITLQVIAQEMQQATAQKIHQEFTAQKIHQEFTAQKIHQEFTAQKIHQAFTAQKIHQEFTAQETHQEIIAQKTHQEIIVQETQQESIAQETHPEIIAQEIHPEIIAQEIHSEIIAQKTFQEIQQIFTQETTQANAQETTRANAQETTRANAQETTQANAQETLLVVPQETSEMVDQEPSKVTAQETPLLVAQETSQVVKQETSQETVQELHQPIIQKIPQVIAPASPPEIPSKIFVLTSKIKPHEKYLINSSKSFPLPFQESTQQSIPVSTQQSIPVSTQQSIPVSTQQMIPVSAQQMISITPQKLDSVMLHSSLQEASSGKIHNSSQNILLLITPEAYNKEKILKTQETPLVTIKTTEKHIEIKPTQIHHQLPPQVLAPIKTRSPTQLRVQLPAKVRLQLQSQVNLQSSPQMRQPSVLTPKFQLINQETNKDGVPTLPQKNSQETIQKNSQERIQKNSQETIQKNSQETIQKNSQETIQKNSQETFQKNSQETFQKNSQEIFQKNSQEIFQKNSLETFQKKSYSIKTQLKPYSTSDIMSSYDDPKMHINEAGGIKPKVTFCNTTSVVNNRLQSPSTKQYVPEINEGNRPTLRSITRAAKRRGAPVNNLLEVQFDNPHPLEYRLRNKKYKLRIEEKNLSIVNDSTNNVDTLKKVSEEQSMHPSCDELTNQKTEQLASPGLKNEKKVEQLVINEFSMSNSIAPIKGSKENKFQINQIKESEIISTNENTFCSNSKATSNNKNKQQMQIATKSVSTENNNNTIPISTNCTTPVNNNPVQFSTTTSNNFNSIEIATTLIATTPATADINNSGFAVNRAMEIASNKTLKQLLTNTRTTVTNNITDRNESSLANKNNEPCNRFDQLLLSDSQAQIISVDKNATTVNDQSSDSAAIIQQTCSKQKKTKERISTNVKPVQLPTLPIDIVSTLKKIENRIEETKNAEHCDSDQEVLILKVCMANKSEQNQMETNQNKQVLDSNMSHPRPFASQPSQRFVATVTSSSKSVLETLPNSINSHVMNLMSPISPPQPKLAATLKPPSINVNTTSSANHSSNILTTSGANNRNQTQLPISHSLPISVAPIMSIGTQPHIITQRVSAESDMIIHKIKEVQNSMVSKPQIISTSSPCTSARQLSPKVVTANKSSSTSLTSSLTTPVYSAAPYTAAPTTVTPSFYATPTTATAPSRTKKRMQSEASQMHAQISKQTPKSSNGRVGEHSQSKQQMSTLMTVQSTPAVSAAAAAAASQLHYQTSQMAAKPPQLLKVANPAPTNPLPWPQKFNDNPRAILNFLETNRQRIYVPAHQNLIPAHTTVNNQSKTTPNSTTILVPLKPGEHTVNLTKSTSIVPPVAHSTNKSILTKDTVSVEANIAEKSNQNKKSENITLQYSPLYLSCQEAAGANSGILCQLLKYNTDSNKSINQNTSAEKMSAEGINSYEQQQLINKLNLGLNRPLFHAPAAKKMANPNDPSPNPMINPAWQSMREYEKYFDIEHLNLYRRKQESMKLNQQRLQLVQQSIDPSSPNMLINSNNLPFGMNTSRVPVDTIYKPSFRPINVATAKDVQVQNHSPAGACAHPLSTPNFSMIDEHNAIARSWNEFEQHYQKILHQQFAEYQSRMEKASIDDRSKPYPGCTGQPKAPPMVERQEFQNCEKDSGTAKKSSFNHPELMNRSGYRGMCGENTCCNSPSNSSIPQTQLTSNAASRMLPIQSSSPIGDRCLQDPKSIFVINGSKKCSELTAADNRSCQPTSAASTVNSMSLNQCSMSSRTQQQLPIRLLPTVDPEQIRRYNAVNMKHKDNECKKANALPKELEDQSLQAHNLNFATFDNHGLHSPSSYHNIMPLNVPNNLSQKGNVVMPVPYRPIPVMQSNYDLPPLLPSNAMDQWAVNKNQEAMMKDNMPPARVMENPNEHCPYEHMAPQYLSVPLMYPHLWNRYN